MADLRLSDSPYLLGSEFSVADLNVAMIMSRNFFAKVSLSGEATPTGLALSLLVSPRLSSQGRAAGSVERNAVKLGVLELPSMGGSDLDHHRRCLSDWHRQTG